VHILITEFMDQRAVDRLSARHDVLHDPKLVDDTSRLLAEAGRADALIVRNRTQVRGDLLAALSRCRAVGRLGVGLDNIDVPGCEARNIRVIPATGANAESVAEYVICTAMLLLRGAYAHSSQVAAGRWPREALGGGRLRLNRPADGAPGAARGHARDCLRCLARRFAPCACRGWGAMGRFR
jgi:(S)-sulfolactate dehydrogenase